MKPDAPQPPPDAREARLTALLHDELPAAESEALQAELAADPALAALFRRLSLAHELARESVRSPEPKELNRPEPLQLSAERREALLAKFKVRPANVVPLPKPKREPRFDYRELIAVAAMLVAVMTAAGMFLPALAKAKSKSSRSLAARAPETEQLAALVEAPATLDLELSRGGANASEAKPREEVSRQLQESRTSPPQDEAGRGNPVLARRYGLIPKDAAGADTGSVVSDGDGKAQTAYRGFALRNGFEIKNPASNQAGDQAGAGGVSANREADFGKVADAGRARDLVRNQIVLPAAEPPLASEPRAGSVRGFWDEQATTLRGQGVGAGGGVAPETHWAFNQSLNFDGRAVDDLSAAGASANAPARFDDLTRSSGGVAGAGFGGGQQFNFGGLQPATPPPAPAPLASVALVAADPAEVRFSVPVTGEKKVSERVVGEDYLRVPAGPTDAKQAERLDRSGGRRGTEDRNAVVKSELAPPQEPATAGTVIELAKGATAAFAVNDPALNSLSPRQATGDFATGNRGENEIPLQQVTIDAPVEFFGRAALQTAEGVAPADKPALGIALGVELALPRIKQSALADTKQLTESLAKAKADSAPKDHTEPERFDKLADLEVGQAVAVAGKPITTLAYDVDAATNAARPVLGDVPALGRMFTGVEAKERVAEGKAEAGDSLALTRDQRDLATLTRMRDILTTKLSQEEVNGVIAKHSPVEIVNEAVPGADETSLFAKLRTGLGGDATKTARLKLEKDTPDIQLLGYASGSQTYDPFFVQTEFELIKSRQILGKAAEKLNLPDTNETYEQLVDKLEVGQFKNTSIVEIRAKDADPARAAQIANAVAKAYEDYRGSNRVERNQRGLEVLKLQLGEISKQIAAKEANLLPLEQSASTPARKPDAPTPKLAPGSPEPPPSTGQQGLPELIQERDRLLSVITQNATGSDIAKRSSVEVLDPALADSKPPDTLFGRVKQALGGDVSRVARILPQRDTRGSRLEVALAGSPAYVAVFPFDQLEIVRSQEVLGRAAVTLGWSTNSGISLGKSSAVDKLKELVSANVYRSSHIIEIHARSQSPDEAARIANAVANAYAEHLKDQETQRIVASEKAIQLRIAELDRRIAVTDRPLPTAADATSKSDDAPLPKLAPGAPEPQSEVATADNAFSTFSLNVSDVSFKLAAAALEKGQMPEPATVRTEEFINAFDYRDPEPAGAAPIAFAWERARYPFAHDRDLVRFSVKTAASGRQPGRPLNLVLLLDNSGSMERADRVRIRQECLRVLAGQLQPQDRVSVVAFARSPRLWVDGLSGAQAAELPGRVGELTPDGGTNLEEGLRVAYQTAARHFAANGVNRVVLLTDGAANLGDVQPASLKRQVETNRQQGIALDCFGIGWEGLNDELLESLSRNGDGRYGFVNTPEAAQSEFAAQLVGALQIAASDVKVQVEWNPRRVTAYRQLGYAKHQLTKEQFRDNTVDAAEIGAAEAGNALYTVQVNPAGEGPLGTVRVRFKVPGTGDYREHEWPLNYDGTARPLEQSGPALRLAASASAFSEWLVSSPHAAEVTPDRLLGLLNGVTETYAADPRPKQFEQMLRQAKSVSGK